MPKQNKIMQEKNLQNDSSQQSLEVYAFPASYTQQQLWFLNQIAPESAVYNIPFAFRLKGKLNIAVLKKSINEIVKRHETFRTTFAIKDDTLVQFINSSLNIQIELFDYSTNPDKDSLATNKISEFTLSPFNLERGPLIRTGLIILAEDDHILMLSFHHTILDDTSVNLFFGELIHFYDCLSNENKYELPPLTIQYADMVVWQQDEKQLETIRPKLEYWKQQLKDQKSFLELPTDKKRPARQTFNGKEKEMSLSSDLSKRIVEFSRKEKKTLFTVLLTAYKILLSRYSGKTDITVGSPFANRNQPGLEDVMGCCMNMLPLRTIFSEHDLFLSVLNKVRDVVFGAQVNQEISFEQIVEQLQPTRDASFNPLFQVSFMFQHPFPKLNLSGIKSKFIEIHSDNSRFDFTFWMWEDTECIKTLIQYNTDLFEEATMDRMFNNFSTLLEDIVESPRKKICDLEILSKAEKKTLLVDWNNTHVSYPVDKCINNLFEETAEKFPNKIAVEFNNNSITYRELDERSNQLANYLIKLGIGSESLVGIFLERSIDMIVGLLGTLKAGSAYVPIDPNYPQNRIHYILNDSKSKIVITTSDLIKRLPDIEMDKLITIDSDWNKINQQSKVISQRHSSEMNLAYIIYTSGSTGLPKGVAIEHRSVVALIYWANKVFKQDELEGVLASTSICFDLSIFEIFITFSRGGKVILVENALQLHSVNSSSRVTLINTVPSVMSSLLQSGNLPSSIRVVNLAGEPLKQDLVEKLYKENSVEKVYDLYGPSEDTTYSTYSLRKSGGYETIGRPIDNTNIYILDNNLLPVPIGATGEIYIGGSGLARGYFEKPELTEERFIKNPFSEGRLYKTGDLAKYLPNGDIQYLGRSDHQVKIRGFRIELGEIESVLSEHESVKQSVVVAREDTEGNSRLVAYLTIEQSELHDTEHNSKEHLSEWQKIWDDAYKAGGKNIDPIFNTIGWVSSYTGNQIPDVEMHEWVDNSVNTILDFKPNNILEVGCGTGLLLFNLAPKCKHYTGLDFSQIGLNKAKEIITAKQLTNVKLLCQEANKLDNLEAGFYDVIIINSVIQYFPNVDYLLNILEKSTAILKPGGKIFIGDVRSRELLDILSMSVEIGSEQNLSNTTEFLKSVSKRVAGEEELLIDPQFFWLLKNRIQGISNVEIRLKRGKFLNELTKYRYDVILHVGDKNEGLNVKKWIDYSKQVVKISDIENALRNINQDIVAIKNIPNTRIYNEVKLFALLTKSEDTVPLSDYLSKLNISNDAGIDPEKLFELSEKYNCTALLTWSIDGLKGHFDAVFKSKDLNKFINLDYPIPINPDLKEYATNPLFPKFRHYLLFSLKEFLKSKLPDYMVPSVFVPLDELPLTPNGKIDRKALPAPELRKSDSTKSYIPPRSETEIQLSALWERTLNIKPISILDNFFELGGHSLLAVQIISSIQEDLQLELSITDIFIYPTIASLAKIIEQKILNEIRSSINS